MADQGATIRRGRTSAISRVNPKGSVSGPESSVTLFSLDLLATEDGATIRRGRTSAISRVNPKGSVSGPESYLTVLTLIDGSVVKTPHGSSARPARYRQFVANPANVAYDSSPADNVVIDEDVTTTQTQHVLVMESVAVTDSVARNVGVPVFVYQTVFSDASTEATDGAIVSESISTAEDLTVVRDARPTTAESVSISELVSHVWTSSLDVSDSVYLNEDQIATPAVEIVESVTVNDQTDLILGIATFEVIDVTEAISSSAGTTADLADTLSIAEEVTPAIGQVQSESVSVTESLEITPGIRISDTLTVSEAIDARQGHYGALDETVIVNDANVSGDGDVVTESVTIEEDIFTSLGAGAEESLAISEALTAQANWQVTLFPIYGVVDSVVAAPAVDVSESVSVSDSLELVPGITLLETVTVSEVVQVLRQALPETFHTITIFEAVAPGYAFFLADSVAISDDVVTTPSYNPHLVENVSISEALLHDQTSSISLSDTITVSDDVLVAPGEQTAEAVDVDDAVAILQGLTLFEAVSVGEYPSTQQTGSTDVEESVTVTDNVAVGSLEATSESVGITDQISTVQVRNVVVAHTVTVTEAVNLQIARTVGLSDSISTTEAFGNMTSFTEDVEETFTVSDAADIVLGAIPTIEETVGLTDTIDHIQTTVEGLPETVTVLDSVFESNNIPINVAEGTISVSDSVVELFSVYPDTTELVTVTETFESLQTGDQLANETVTLTENSSEAAALAETLLETVTVSDAVLESLGVPISADETVTITEALTNLQTFEEPQAETVTVTEALVESAGTEYALSESVTVTEAETEVFDVRPTTSETVSVSDAIGHTQTMEEVPSETVALTENITIGFPVDVVDAVSLTEAVDHAQGHFTDAADNAAVAEGLLPVFGGTVEDAETVPLSDSVDYYVGIFGTAVESVTVFEAVADQVDFSQMVAEPVTVTETRLNADQFSILFHTVVVNETLDISQTFTQEVSESVSVSDDATAVRGVSPIFLAEAVAVVDGIGFLGGKSVLVNETVSVASGIGVPYRANVLAPVSLSVTENSVAQNDYIRNLSEIVTMVVSAFTEGSAAAASLTPTTVQMFVGVEVHPNSLTNLAAYDVTPIDGGVPVRVLSIELIQPTKESGGNASVQESGYHIFFPYTNVVDVGDYLDIEGAHYSFESLRITTVDNVNQIVTVDRRVISTDPKNGELTWVLRRAATGALITISEATANATYRICMRQLDRKQEGFVDVDTTFVALDPEPVSETYSTDPLTGSITITFSRPIAVEPALLRPSLYSVSGPSEVSVVSVSMPAPNQVLVRTTPTFVSGSYHLAFPPLRDQALNRIGV